MTGRSTRLEGMTGRMIQDDVWFQQNEWTNVCSLARLKREKLRKLCVTVLVALYIGDGDRHECESYRGISLFSVSQETG